MSAEIHIIDVGHGDSSLIKLSSPKTQFNILIDGGKADMDDRIMTYFQGKVNKIDLVVITHACNDHIDGILSLLSKENFWFMCKGVVSHICTNLVDYIEENLKKYKNYTVAKVLNDCGGVLQGEVKDGLEIFSSLSDKKLESVVKDITNFFANHLINTYGNEYITKIIEYLKNNASLENTFLAEVVYKKLADKYADSRYNFFPTKKLPGEYFQHSAVIYNVSVSDNLVKSICEGNMGPNIFTVNSDSLNKRFGFNRNVLCVNSGDIGKDILQHLEIDLPDHHLTIVATDGCTIVNGGMSVYGDSNKNNCNSLALMLDFDGFVYYTAGDLPTRGENEIVHYYLGGKYETLDPNKKVIFGYKVSHHGSNSACGEDIQLLAPLYAFISCGDVSGPIHPGTDTVKSLVKMQSVSKVYCTSWRNPIPIPSKFRVAGYLSNKICYRGDISCYLQKVLQKMYVGVSYNLYAKDLDMCFPVTDHLLPNNELPAEAPPVSRIVLIPGLLEFDNISWKIDNNVYGFETEWQIGQVCMQINCYYLENFKQFDARMTGKDGSLLSLGDIVDWLKPLHSLEGLSDFISMIGLDRISFSGMRLLVNTETAELINLTIYGNADFGELKFSLLFEMPNFVLTAKLMSESPLNLETWLEKAGLKKEELAFLGDLQLTGISLYADFQMRDYAFSLALDPQKEGFGFTGVSLNLHYGFVEDVSVTMTARFLFSKCYVDMDGRYSGGKWALEGSMRMQEHGMCLEFSRIPVVGDYLPKDMGLEISSARLGYDGGLYLDLDICCCGENMNFRLAQQGVGNTLTAGAPINGEAFEMNKRFDFSKQLGPLRVDALTVQLTPEKLLLTPELSVQLGGFTASITDVSMGIDLTNESAVFVMNGLAMSYEAAQLEIAAAFRRALSTEMAYQFDGEAAVKAAKWQFMGIGSYGKTVDGDISAYFFVDVGIRLAVQPSIIITDIMGGAGIHRELKLPQISEVENFPLVKGGKTSLEIIKELDTQWLTVNKNEDWLAVGVGFEVAGLFDGKALLAADLGETLEFALIGSGRLDLPKQSKEKYLHLGLNLEARLQPQAGIFSVEVVLGADSYLLCKDCHITGGAAFYTWFGNHPNKGDFVITAGGYHPAFVIPEHYPKVDPVGISWQISSHVSLTGQTYFALTPSCAMAGGQLAIDYADGNLKAWFHAYANLLVAWKPFHFLAEIGVELGVSYRLNLLFCHKTISVSIGGDLKLWGPPTGGEVKVHLWFISFTVRFGQGESADSNAKELNWDEFKALLPQSDILGIEPVDGLVGQSDGVWKVRANSLRFAVNSATPAGSIVCGDECAAQNGSSIDIRPMNLTNVNSVLKVRIEKEGEAAGSETLFNMEEKRDNVSASLWGCPQQKDGHFVQNSTAPTAELITDQLLGGELSVSGETSGPTLNIPDLEAISVITNDEEKHISLTLTDYRLPGLKAGSYRITLEQNLSHDDTNFTQDISPCEQRIVVGGYQFDLPSSLIKGCYPLDGSIGSCQNALPHVLLGDSILPWERAFGASEENPWLALFVFAKDEFEETNNILSMSIQEFIVGTEDAHRPKLVCEPGTDTSKPCSVLRIPMELYQKLLPTERELKLLCHGRTDDGSREDYAVVMANRFPQKGENIVHLVSLEGAEGMEQYKDGKPVELLSLYSFSFQCTEEENEDFYRAAVRLKDANPTHMAFGNSCAACDCDGYLQLRYRGAVHEGADTMRYRGPLIPVDSADTDDPQILEAARQAGRLAALSDTAYLQALMSYRKKWTQPPQETHPLKKIASGLRRGETQILEARPAAHWNAVCRSVFETKEPARTNAVIRSPSGAQACGRDRWEKSVKQETDAMNVWFTQLIRLESLPYGYLVPIQELLPAESVRFFRLDKQWLKAMIRGAAEIGETCSRQKGATQELRQRWEADVDAANICGVVLRSAIFTRWKNAAVHLYDADKQELEILRGEMLSEDTYLLLCNAPVVSLRIREPAEGIRMQVNEDMSVSPRYPDSLQPCPEKYRSGGDWSWYKDEDCKILNISGDKGLEAMFEKALGLSAPLTSSQFALQFIEGVRSLWI